ncbi:MAG: DUF4129 domain-containing protein [Dehalococcoidia bacterium]|nr:DUF4129 domain-containing protein [Dehalococcoidia bacterium]
MTWPGVAGTPLDVRGSRWTPSEGWVTAALALAMNLTVIVAMERARWTDPSPRFWMVGLLAFAVGMITAKVARGWVREIAAGALALALGAGVVLWEAAGTLPAGTAGARLDEAASRVSGWLTAVGSTEISNDRLPFALMLTALVWLMAYFSAWLVFRHRWVWPALLLPALGLLENQTYLPNSRYPLPLAFFLLFALLLIGWVAYVSREERWGALGLARRASRVTYVGSVLTLAALVLGVGWAIPTRDVVVGPLRDSYQTVREPWAGLETEWERVFAGIASKKSSALHTFGGALPLRGGIALGSDVAFLVTTDYPSYWRGQTYDFYEGRGWLAQGAQRDTVQGNTAFADATGSSFKKREPVALRVTMQTGADVVFTAGQPLDVSVPVTAEVAMPKTFTFNPQDAKQVSQLPPDLARAAGRMAASPATDAQRLLPSETRLVQQNQGGNVVVTRVGPTAPDILALRTTASLKPGASYEAINSVSVATEAELRSDTPVYPKWVTDSYMQLPAGLPLRVRDLAAQVTKDASTPYDKAQAISEYLKGYTLTRRIEPPPVNADAVDYFLFVQRAGYSDYFASAMTVLLRASGVPARLAAGYGTGEFDEATSTFAVRFGNAHAWPEAYFPSYGWITFEAAPGSGTILRGPRPVAGALPEDIFEDPQGPLEFFDPFVDVMPPDIGSITRPETPASVGEIFKDVAVKGGMALGALAALGAAALALVFLTWESNFLGLGYAEGIYARMSRLGGWAWRRQEKKETPREYAAALARSEGLPSREVDAIAAGYMRRRYGGKDTEAEEREEMETAWRAVRGMLIRRAAGRADPRRMLRRQG